MTTARRRFAGFYFDSLHQAHIDVGFVTAISQIFETDELIAMGADRDFLCELGRLACAKLEAAKVPIMEWGFTKEPVDRP